jgi:hypothetical protein
MGDKNNRQSRIGKETFGFGKKKKRRSRGDKKEMSGRLD